MISRFKNSIEHLVPILHRLIIHFHEDMLDDRRPHALVREGKSNGPIAAIELENRPDRSAHLLALDVSRVTGDAQRTEPDKSRDDCFVSAGPARRLFLRHGADSIAGKMGVNQSSRLNFQQNYGRLNDARTRNGLQRRGENESCRVSDAVDTIGAADGCSREHSGTAARSRCG